MRYESDRRPPYATDYGRRRRRGLFARWWLWLLIGLLLQFVSWPPALADRVYTHGVHPVLSSLTSRLHDAVPLSLAAALAMLFVIVAVLGLLSGRGGRRGAFTLLGWWLAASAILFPLTFGLAYRTPTLESRLGIGDAATAVSLTGEQLASAGDAVAVVLNEASDTRQRVGAAGNVDPVEAASRCLAGYLQRTGLPGGSSLPTVVKGFPDGALLRLGTSGFIYPWLLEPHVDPGLPDEGFLAVALHELTHAAGYAREAEAEALGLLAGLECGDPRVRYAAALSAARSIADALPASSAAAYLALWPAGAEDDWLAIREAHLRYRWAAGADLMRSANDAYLVSQGIAGGIADYSRATTLMALLLLREPAEQETQP